MVLKSFNDAIEAKGLSLANEAIMRKLCSLYAMYRMVQNSGEFMTVSGPCSVHYSWLCNVRQYPLAASVSNGRILANA